MASMLVGPWSWCHLLGHKGPLTEQTRTNMSARVGKVCGVVKLALVFFQKKFYLPPKTDVFESRWIINPEFIHLASLRKNIGQRSSAKGRKRPLERGRKFNFY